MKTKKVGQVHIMNLNRLIIKLFGVSFYSKTQKAARHYVLSFKLRLSSLLSAYAIIASSKCLTKLIYKQRFCNFLLKIYFNLFVPIELSCPYTLDNRPLESNEHEDETKEQALRL